MRYITFPEPLPIPGSKDPKDESKPKLFGLSELLTECWAAPQWRDSDSANEAFVRVYDAFENKKPGDVVELENKDYEIFAPIVTMKGKPIPNQLIAPLFNKISIAVLAAPSKPPKSNGAAKELPASEDVKKLPDKTEEAAAEE